MGYEDIVRQITDFCDGYDLTDEYNIRKLARILHDGFKEELREEIERQESEWRCCY